MKVEVNSVNFITYILRLGQINTVSSNYIFSKVTEICLSEDFELKINKNVLKELAVLCELLLSKYEQNQSDLFCRTFLFFQKSALEFIVNSQAFQLRDLNTSFQLLCKTFTTCMNSSNFQTKTNLTKNLICTLKSNLTPETLRFILTNLISSKFVINLAVKIASSMSSSCHKKTTFRSQQILLLNMIFEKFCVDTMTGNKLLDEFINQAILNNLTYRLHLAEGLERTGMLVLIQELIDVSTIYRKKLKRCKTRNQLLHKHRGGNVGVLFSEMMRMKDWANSALSGTLKNKWQLLVLIKLVIVHARASSKDCFLSRCVLWNNTIRSFSKREKTGVVALMLLINAKFAKFSLENHSAIKNMLIKNAKLQMLLPSDAILKVDWNEASVVNDADWKYVCLINEISPVKHVMPHLSSKLYEFGNLHNCSRLQILRYYLLAATEVQGMDLHSKNKLIKFLQGNIEIIEKRFSRNPVLIFLTLKALRQLQSSHLSQTDDMLKTIINVFPLLHGSNTWLLKAFNEALGCCLEHSEPQSLISMKRVNEIFAHNNTIYTKDKHENVYRHPANTKIEEQLVYRIWQLSSGRC